MAKKFKLSKIELIYMAKKFKLSKIELIPSALSKTTRGTIGPVVSTCAMRKQKM